MSFQPTNEPLLMDLSEPILLLTFAHPTQVSCRLSLRNGWQNRKGSAIRLRVGFLRTKEELRCFGQGTDAEKIDDRHANQRGVFGYIIEESDQRRQAVPMLPSGQIRDHQVRGLWVPQHLFHRLRNAIDRDTFQIIRDHTHRTDRGIDDAGGCVWISQDQFFDAS